MAHRDFDKGYVNTRLISGILLIAVVAFTVVFYFHQKQMDELQNRMLDLNGTLLATPQVINNFSLVDNEGRPFTLNDLKGHWSFVVFGFTSCAQVCPKTMSELDQVAKIIKKWGLHAPQFVMVSVDPVRDTTERLNEYIKSYNDDFIAATGNKYEIDSLARDLSVMYLKIKNDEGDLTAAEFTVDHSGTVMLINPEGKLRAVFSMPHSAEVIAKDYRTISSRRFLADQFGLLHRRL